MKVDYAHVKSRLDALEVSDLLVDSSVSRTIRPRSTETIVHKAELATTLEKIDSIFADPSRDEQAPLRQGVMDPAVAKLPGGAAFGTLLGVDLSDLDEQALDAIEEPLSAHTVHTRALKDSSIFEKLKQAYAGLKQFLAKLRTGVLAFQTSLLADRPVSLSIHLELLGDVHLKVIEKKDADGAAWSAARSALAEWQETSVSALVLSIAVLGKAVEFLVKIVLAVVNSYKAIKIVISMLVGLYQFLSRELKPKAET